MFFAAISAISKINFEFHTHAHYTLGKYRLPLFYGGFLYLLEAAFIFWRLPLSSGGCLYLLEAASIFWRLPLSSGGLIVYEKKVCPPGTPGSEKICV